MTLRCSLGQTGIQHTANYHFLLGLISSPSLPTHTSTFFSFSFTFQLGWFPDYTPLLITALNSDSQNLLFRPSSESSRRPCFGFWWPRGDLFWNHSGLTCIQIIVGRTRNRLFIRWAFLGALERTSPASRRRCPVSRRLNFYCSSKSCFPHWRLLWLTMS